jgi:hypothetical protein
MLSKNQKMNLLNIEELNKSHQRVIKHRINKKITLIIEDLFFLERNNFLVIPILAKKYIDYQKNNKQIIEIYLPYLIRSLIKNNQSINDVIELIYLNFGVLLKRNRIYYHRRSTRNTINVDLAQGWINYFPEANEKIKNFINGKNDDIYPLRDIRGIEEFDKKYGVLWWSMIDSLEYITLSLLLKKDRNNSSIRDEVFKRFRFYIIEERRVNPRSYNLRTLHSSIYYKINSLKRKKIVGNYKIKNKFFNYIKEDHRDIAANQVKQYIAVSNKIVQFIKTYI